MLKITMLHHVVTLKIVIAGSSTILAAVFQTVIVTSQKTIIFMVTAVSTSDLTAENICTIIRHIVFQIADSFPGLDAFAQAPPQRQQQQLSPVDLRKPPKWLRRPVGASFGVSSTPKSS
jgi:hypothetical protein